MRKTWGAEKRRSNEKEVKEIPNDEEIILK